MAALRLATFRLTRRRSPEDLAAYIREIFLANPWRDEALPSLVYEDAQGRVAGFVGVIPRRMTFRGVPVRVAVSTQFMVDPASRGPAGIQLVQRLFAGPQDLTLGDAAPDAARKIWVGLGGSVAMVHSLFWTRAVRPFRFAATELGDRPLIRVARLLLRPLLNGLDSAWRAGSRGTRRPLAGRTEPLTVSSLAAAAPGIIGDRALHPVYDEPGLRWLLERVAEVPHLEPLEAVLVRDAGGAVAGWFLYFPRRGGTAQVFQLGSTARTAPLVIQHLLQHARQHGAVGVTGRVDPVTLSALEAAGCILHRRGPWVLVQTRRPDLLAAIERGDAWLSSLDGERWLSF